MKPDIYYEDGKRITSPEYRTWQMMKNRCLNKNAMDYEYYGGRGITICNKWLVFSGFLEDMGRRPSATHTIDRVDNSNGYLLSNCKWATRQEQAQNRDYCKLNNDLANEIRSKYTTGIRQVDLAAVYGVCPRTISLIVRRETWI